MVGRERDSKREEGRKRGEIKPTKHDLSTFETARGHVRARERSIMARSARWSVTFGMAHPGDGACIVADLPHFLNIALEIIIEASSM